MHQNNMRLSDPEVRVLVGGAVAVRRAQLGMSQAEAALLMGWHQGALSRLERGGAPATVTMLAHVAPALHTSPWLLVAQAVGTPDERHMAEQLQRAQVQFPGVWRTMRALLRQPAGETIP